MAEHEDKVKVRVTAEDRVTERLQHAENVVMDRLEVSEIVAVLVGQCDGKVFISRQAVQAIRRMVLHVQETHDFAKDGWYLWLEPAHSDGEVAL